MAARRHPSARIALGTAISANSDYKMAHHLHTALAHGVPVEEMASVLRWPATEEGC
ncbi:carboxymuconolactone decarboxylase family protein [Streptomyces chartreusis]|uniref:Carboxymuconolactone decarboxylase family protein n=1 Tax=Streptomyces chartreusis TaxID=1969 RepID=A0A7H8T5T1_STRCX|nr:carboxymuconolactone decarboxylase family protein [Streptomyces chartreusis]QKZ18843.1 carboxymuconolactone decarboxylase family protein [Streptomyces chartreusis]